MRLRFILVLPSLVLGCAKSDVQSCVDARMKIWKDAPYVNYGDPRFFTHKVYKGNGWWSEHGQYGRKDDKVKRKMSKYGWTSKAEHEAAAWDRCATVLKKM